MKKLIALLLVLVMVIPMGLIAASAEEAEVRPYVMVNWGSGVEGVDNVFLASYFWTNSKDVKKPLEVSAFNSTKIKTIAKNMKAEMDSRPEGARHINFAAPLRVGLVHYAENIVYLDKGAKVVSEWLTEFMDAYVAIGGKLDGVVLDLEYVDTGAYYINKAANEDPHIYKKIVDDPRYKTVLRPLLEQQGFRFWEEISDYSPEIFSISTSLGDDYAMNRTIWDTVVSILKTQYMDQAVSEVVWKYFPDAVISDYQVSDFKGWFRPVDSEAGTSYKTGNSSNENMYFIRPSAEFYESKGERLFNSPDTSYVAAYFDQTPFNQALYETNLFKNIYASTDSHNLTAWIPFYDYGTNSKDHAYYANKASNTAYYSEIVFHIGLLDPHPFLGYIYKGDVESGKYGSYEQKIEVASQVLHELTRVAGAADREPLFVPAAWNNSYILSGICAGGRNVWRITPDTSKISVEDFKVEGTDPTFSVNGKTITFPGGKIITDGQVDEVGTCGYWVETAKDVYPVVTTDADRYEKYPALLTDFESWKPGAFNHNNVYPLGGWEMKKSGKTSSAEVIANGDGQAMALTGTFTLINDKMPANINAGDSYAEQQAWEVTVTVPEGLAAEAEIILLNYEGKKQKIDDGGFKITGGKLYYSVPGEEDPEYKELTALGAGTYTLRREVDLTNAEALTCSYYVYDAEGKALGEAKDVAMPAFTLPVNSISMGVKNADKAVIIDDYKIMLTGVATDFMLYHVSNGMKVTELDQLQSKDVAYRVGWLNATDKEQTASVVAAFYEGETLVSESVVKEVKMAPGCDSIETGIVEVAEGKSVKVYLKTGDEAGDGKGDAGNKLEGNSLWIILIGAAVVVVVAAIVIALVVTKKPAKKAEAEETQESEEPQTSEEE